MTERQASSLYPRLLHSYAAELAEELRSLSLSELESRADTEHPYTIFTPTGGSRIGERALGKVREGAREIARNAGYPDPFPDAPSLDARYEFDFEIARFLHRKMAIPPGEAGKNDVWEFVACVLIPELVRWRFPGNQKSDFRTNTDRYLGGERNAFQRLWWRAELLGEEGDYRLLEELNEDELVQIMERPYMASQRKLARATARQFVEVIDEHPDVDRMELMRNAQKRLRRLTPLVSFSTLDPEDLDREVSRVFADAAKAVSDIEVVAPKEREGGEDAPDESEPSEHSSPVESLVEEIDSELKSDQRAILNVLAEEFPERLDAREIAGRAESRLDDRGEASPDNSDRISRTDVNRLLYRYVEEIFDKTGKSPPQWRIDPAAAPDSISGEGQEGPEPDDGGDGLISDSAGLAEALIQEIGPDVQPPDRAVMRVLADSFPQRLHAGEVAERVRSRVEDGSRVSKFEVDRLLYRHLEDVFEKSGREPPRWRIARSAVPDRIVRGEPEDPGDRVSSGGQAATAAAADSDSSSVDAAGAEDFESREEEEGSYPGRYRVSLEDQLGNVTAQLQVTETGDGKGGRRVQVLSRLVEIQTPYFQNGPRVMKPLTRQELADDVGVQPETVSSAVDHALLVFDGKEIPAEDLFSPGLPTSSGGEVSATAVRDMIAELLTTERDDGESLTDAEITSRLRDRGIEIAPGTVAKYRGQLGIDDEEAEQAGASGIGVRTRPYSGDASSGEGGERDRADLNSDESGGRTSGEDAGGELEGAILRVLAESDIQMTALEIAQHLIGTDRDEVKSVLEGSLKDRVDSEGVSPPRWTVKKEEKKADRGEEEGTSLDLVNRAILETLGRSPYRLSADEIAKTVNEETELEIDETAVEAILRGPLEEKVTVHPGTTTRWTAQKD